VTFITNSTVASEALRSQFSLREEGEVAWLESPDGLDATAEFQVHEKSSTKILISAEF